MTTRASLAKAQSPGIVPYVGVGYAWFAGSGILTAGGTNTIRITMKNPAGSGVNISLARIRASMSHTHILEAFINPTTNLPSASRLISNCILDGRVYGGLTEVKADVGAVLSGGIELSVNIGLGGEGGDVIVDGPFIIPPGNMLGLCTHVQPGTVEGVISALWEEH